MGINNVLMEQREPPRLRLDMQNGLDKEIPKFDPLIRVAASCSQSIPHFRAEGALLAVDRRVIARLVKRRARSETIAQ